MGTDDWTRIRRSALEVVLTWGPERATPEAQRLSALHRGLDDAAITAALREAHEVMAEAEALAPAVKGTGRSPTTRSRIRGAHDWLTDDLLDRAVNQGLYFHWRETGL